jgi:DNA-binding beta-propeller fold protein YncE
MFRTFAIGFSAVVLSVLLTSPGLSAAGIAVPPPRGDYQLSTLAADAGGTLYACDGDTVFRLQGSAFTPVVTGLVSTVGGAWVDPSSFVVNGAGTRAYMATGSTGRLVEVDLAAGSARELTGATRSWVYGNYGLAIDPIYGNIFLTDSYNQDVYRVDPSGAGSLSLVKHFTSPFGGALAFSPTGELYVPVPTAYAAWPTDDNFPMDMYRFSRAWLDDIAAGRTPSTDAVLYAHGLSVSGTGFMAADALGAVYLEAADAIYRVAPDGTLTTFLGDPTKNVFDSTMTGAGFMGLAFDPASDQMYYAYRDTAGQTLTLGEHAAPEPATALMLGLGGVILAIRRRRR